MIKYLLLGFIFITINTQAQDSLNISLIANITLSEKGNDIWGYVHSDGTEYAIMGSNENTWIWSLEDPANPQLRAKIEGDESAWRDIKSWEDHLYVTADDGDDGLLIIDMSQAPDVITHKYITPDIFIKDNEIYSLDTLNNTIDTLVVQDTMRLGPCHNLYIDENGYCYLAGCRIDGANKALILDLNEDKWSPTIVGRHGLGGENYAHDVYVKNNIMYASEINAGKLAIYDVSNKDTLVFLGSTKTSSNFTHNAWTSNDQNYVFTTDERANAFIDAFDISDLTNIVKIDRYRPLETEGTGVIPHNTHYYDGFLVTSYYTDGLVVVDASNPSNLIKVGSYDTYTGSETGFNGCWGAYPFLPSGLILASDINSGLYIFQPSYQRAAFLEGTVTDAETGEAINAVGVKITASQENFDWTNAAGQYKNGIATAGTYSVVFANENYEKLTAEATLENGEITILDVELTPLPRISYSGIITDEETGNPIENAIINFVSNNDIKEFKSDVSGEFNVDLIDQDYTLLIGKWGYNLKALEIKEGSDLTFFTTTLSQEYKDDFELDLGWETFSNATSGAWTRGIPIATFATGVPIAPGVDDPFDFGEQCYVTGNGGGAVNLNDVDDGTVVLASPPINIKKMNDPILSYKYWFTNLEGEGPINDTLFVNICNDTICHTVSKHFGNQNDWSERVEIPILDYTGIDSELRVEFITSDFSTPESDGHIVEAAIDAFLIFEKNTTSVKNEVISFVDIYPNPFENQINLSSLDKVLVSYSVYDVQGRMVKTGKINGKQEKIALNLLPGVYTLKVNDIDGQSVIKKIVKN